MEKEMNIEEQNKAREFYFDSDIDGLHCTITNTVELNYLDLLKLMTEYAHHQVINNGVLDAVIKCDHQFDRIDAKRIQCIKCEQVESRR
jgi:hypothetical protein